MLWALFAIALLLLIASRIRIVDGAPAVEAHSAAPAAMAHQIDRPAFVDGRALLGVPVLGISRTSLSDSWGDIRGAGSRKHQGIDIIAPGGRLVVAAAPGTVEKLFLSDAGGVTVYVRSPDRRWSYYYAHLAGYVAGLSEGRRLRTGDPIGYVGDTGDAGPGNYHLHFGVSRMAPGDSWWQGEPVNPYPLLARADRQR